MSPLSFLSVPISGFIPLSKASKWTIRLFFQHVSINSGIYPIYIQWDLNTVPTSHATVIAVWISLVWVDHHHERKKRPELLWVAARGLLIFVFFTSSSQISESFKIKTAWSDTSMVWNLKSKSLLSPFSTWVLTGAPISTKRAHMGPTFLAQYLPPLKMAYTVEL